MLRGILFAVLIMFSANAMAFDHRPEVRELRAAMIEPDAHELSQRVVRAVDKIIERSAGALRDEGYTREALDLEYQWGSKYARMMSTEGLGDHAAWSQWLADTYAKLEALLGKEACEFLHLDDINIVNFAVPVALHLKVIGDDVIDAAEYELHFVPLMGVLAYWGVNITCQIATSGTGWFLICNPAGMAAEFATVTWVAPRFSDRVWAAFYDQFLDCGDGINCPEDPCYAGMECPDHPCPDCPDCPCPDCPCDDCPDGEPCPDDCPCDCCDHEHSLDDHGAKQL